MCLQNRASHTIIPIRHYGDNMSPRSKENGVEAKEGTLASRSLISDVSREQTSSPKF